MQIKAIITGIEYQSKLMSELKEFDIKNFNINNLPSSSIIKDGHFSFGLSKWVSPKRTRSYPYARVYNTLGNSKKITVIPIIDLLRIYIFNSLIISMIQKFFLCFARILNDKDSTPSRF